MSNDIFPLKSQVDLGDPAPSSPSDPSALPSVGPAIAGTSLQAPIAPAHRPLKFRAWDGIKMHYPADGQYLAFFSAPNQVAWRLYERNGEGYVCDAQYGGAAMQFTGLKDKNGRDIYESDFLKHPDEEDPIQVVWHPPTAGFGLTKRGWMYVHYFREALEAHDCEVIGNVHQGCVSDRSGATEGSGPTKEDGTHAERDPKGDAQEEKPQ